MKRRLSHAISAAVLLLLSLGTMADNESYSQAELNQLLAPVALYPDTVLSHVLIASTYPLEVVQAHRWAERHPTLEGGAALAAAENEPWDPSVRALVAFPDLLERMSEDLDWTRELGDAFLQDEEAVLASVQDLRQRAYESGHLKTTEHQEVVVERQTIIVEPRAPEVIYLPYYDTRVVYGPWRWHHHPPVVWHRPARGYWHGGIFWSFGTRIDRHHFYFSGFHWSNHHTVVIDLTHHHHRPRFHSSRSVVRYKEAKRWRHNPSHRRGVEYRHSNVRKKYVTPRNHHYTSTATERHQRAETLERRLQAQPERRRHSEDIPRLQRQPSYKQVPSARQDERSNRLEQRMGAEQRERANTNERRDRAGADRHARSERTQRQQPRHQTQRDRSNEQRHRQPERSQQNFQRSMRDRVEGARNSRSITDRARER